MPMRFTIITNNMLKTTQPIKNVYEDSTNYLTFFSNKVATTF